MARAGPSPSGAVVSDAGVVSAVRPQSLSCSPPCLPDVAGEHSCDSKSLCCSEDSAFPRTPPLPGEQRSRSAAGPLFGEESERKSRGSRPRGLRSPWVSESDRASHVGADLAPLWTFFANYACTLENAASLGDESGSASDLLRCVRLPHFEAYPSFSRPRRPRSAFCRECWNESSLVEAPAATSARPPAAEGEFPAHVMRRGSDTFEDPGGGGNVSEGECQPRGSLEAEPASGCLADLPAQYRKHGRDTGARKDFRLGQKESRKTHADKGRESPENLQTYEEESRVVHETQAAEVPLSLTVRRSEKAAAAARRNLVQMMAMPTTAFLDVEVQQTVGFPSAHAATGSPSAAPSGNVVVPAFAANNVSLPSGVQRTGGIPSVTRSADRVAWTRNLRAALDSFVLLPSWYGGIEQRLLLQEAALLLTNTATTSLLEAYVVHALERQTRARIIPRMYGPEQEVARSSFHAPLCTRRLSRSCCGSGVSSGATAPPNSRLASESTLEASVAQERMFRASWLTGTQSSRVYPQGHMSSARLWAQENSMLPHFVDFNHSTSFFAGFSSDSFCTPALSNISGNPGFLSQVSESLFPLMLDDHFLPFESYFSSLPASPHRLLPLLLLRGSLAGFGPATYTRDPFAAQLECGPGERATGTGESAYVTSDSDGARRHLRGEGSSCCPTTGVGGSLARTCPDGLHRVEQSRAGQDRGGETAAYNLAMWSAAEAEAFYLRCLYTVRKISTLYQRFPPLFFFSKKQADSRGTPAVQGVSTPAGWQDQQQQRLWSLVFLILSFDLSSLSSPSPVSRFLEGDEAARGVGYSEGKDEGQRANRAAHTEKGQAEAEEGGRLSLVAEVLLRSAIRNGRVSDVLLIILLCLRAVLHKARRIASSSGDTSAHSHTEHSVAPAPSSTSSLPASSATSPSACDTARNEQKRKNTGLPLQRWGSHPLEEFQLMTLFDDLSWTVATPCSPSLSSSSFVLSSDARVLEFVGGSSSGFGESSAFLSPESGDASPRRQSSFFEPRRGSLSSTGNGPSSSIVEQQRQAVPVPAGRSSHQNLTASRTGRAAGAEGGATQQHPSTSAGEVTGRHASGNASRQPPGARSGGRGRRASAGGVSTRTERARESAQVSRRQTEGGGSAHANVFLSSSSAARESGGRTRRFAREAAEHDPLLQIGRNSSLTSDSSPSSGDEDMPRTGAVAAVRQPVAVPTRRRSSGSVASGSHRGARWARGRGGRREERAVPPELDDDGASSGGNTSASLSLYGREDESWFPFDWEPGRLEGEQSRRPEGVCSDPESGGGILFSSQTGRRASRRRGNREGGRRWLAPAALGVVFQNSWGAPISSANAYSARQGETENSLHEGVDTDAARRSQQRGDSSVCAATPVGVRVRRSQASLESPRLIAARVCEDSQSHTVTYFQLSLGVEPSDFDLVADAPSLSSNAEEGGEGGRGGGAVYFPQRPALSPQLLAPSSGGWGGWSLCNQTGASLLRPRGGGTGIFSRVASPPGEGRLVCRYTAVSPSLRASPRLAWWEGLGTAGRSRMSETIHSSLSGLPEAPSEGEQVEASGGVVSSQGASPFWSSPDVSESIVGESLRSALLDCIGQPACTVTHTIVQEGERESLLSGPLPPALVRVPRLSSGEGQGTSPDPLLRQSGEGGGSARDPETEEDVTSQVQIDTQTRELLEGELSSTGFHGQSNGGSGAVTSWLPSRVSSASSAPVGSDCRLGDGRPARLVSSSQGRDARRFMGLLQRHQMTAQLAATKEAFVSGVHVCQLLVCERIRPALLVEGVIRTTEWKPNFDGIFEVGVMIADAGFRTAYSCERRKTAGSRQHRLWGKNRHDSTTAAEKCCRRGEQTDTEEATAVQGGARLLAGNGRPDQRGSWTVRRGLRANTRRVGGKPTSGPPVSPPGSQCTEAESETDDESPRESLRLRPLRLAGERGGHSGERGGTLSGRPGACAVRSDGLGWTGWGRSRTSRTKGRPSRDGFLSSSLHTLPSQPFSSEQCAGVRPGQHDPHEGDTERQSCEFTSAYSSDEASRDRETEEDIGMYVQLGSRWEETIAANDRVEGGKRVWCITLMLNVEAGELDVFVEGKLVRVEREGCNRFLLSVLLSALMYIGFSDLVCVPATAST